MKTIILASIAVINVAATTASASAAERSVPRYSATYDAQRDVYCVRGENPRAIEDNPSTSIRRCRRQADWAMYGLQISRKQAPAEIAQR